MCPTKLDFRKSVRDGRDDVELSHHVINECDTNTIEYDGSGADLLSLYLHEFLPSSVQRGRS